jgi:putative membrane protein
MRHIKLFVFVGILLIGAFVLLRMTSDNDSVRGQDGAVETRGTNTDGLPPVGTSGADPSSAADGAWRGDSAFAAQAAETNASAIRLADLAQRRAASPDVRRYASALHRDHTAAGQELAALAGRRQWTPASLDGLQAQAREALDRAQGPEFDQAFLDAMIASHEKALVSFRAAAASAGDAELKAFAGAHLTTLQNHLEHARTLKNR